MTRSRAERGFRERSLLRHLIEFGVALTLPMLIYLGVVLWKYADTERARMEDAALTLARSIAVDINQEIAGLAASLQILATSEQLGRGDFSRFTIQLDTASRSTGVIAILRTRDGDIRAAPPTFHATRIEHLPSIATVDAREDRLIAISNYFVDPGVGASSFMMDVPVTARTDPDLVLSLIVPATRLLDLMARTPVPPNWVAGVFDADGIILARNVEHRDHVGKKGVSDLIQKFSTADGTWTGRRLDGTPTFVAFAQSSATDWRATVFITESELNAPLRRSLRIMGLTGISLATLALLMAWGIGRRMTSALDRLTTSASLVAQGGLPGQLFTPIDEINRVGRGLAHASEDLRQRGDELAASKERLARILDATPSGIIEIAADGMVTYANRMLGQLLRTGADQVVGRNYRTLVASASDPNGAPLAMDDLPLARALRGESTIGFEQVLTTTMGHKMTLSINAEPVRSREGAIVGALAAVADVTTRFSADAARQRSESRLRSIIDTVPVGIVLAEAPSGRIVEGNAAVEAILRHKVIFTGNMELYGEWIAFHENGRQVTSAEYPLARALLGVEKRPELECRYRRGDGTLVWIKITGVALRNDADVITGAIVAVVDIDDIKQAQSQQRLMNRELHHRVKNTLATVQAIANLTARSTTDITAFRQTFADRIVSLSRTHTLLVENSWERIPLGDLVRLELDPYRTHGNEQVTLDGGDIWLASDIGLALGMAIHELTTNALKYGALSTPTGRVHVSWRVEPDAEKQKFMLDWSESGGPTVALPSRSGFGSQLLMNILARQLKGEVDVDYAPSGLRVRIKADF